MAVSNNLNENIRWLKENNVHLPRNIAAKSTALAPKLYSSTALPEPLQAKQRTQGYLLVDSDEEEDDFIDLTGFSKPQAASQKSSMSMSKEILFVSSDDEELDYGALSSRSSSIKTSADLQEPAIISPPEDEAGLPDLNQPPPSWAAAKPAVPASYNSLQWSDDECQVNGTPLNSELPGTRVQAHYVEDTGVKLNKIQAEKIGLLERKIDVLTKRLASAGISVDLSALDKKLAGLDFDMANLEDDAVVSSQDSVICDKINHLSGENAQDPSPYFSRLKATQSVVDLTMENVTSIHSTADAVPQPTPQHKVTTPWHDELMKLLRAKFGLVGFRQNQLEAIDATISGRDVVVLMPTGGGKSLCYQLPALIQSGPRKGTTIVISPLISLMQDQIYHLETRNIAAKMVNSRLSLAERNEAMNQLDAGELVLLYLSPEMLNKSDRMRNTLQRMYQNNRIARIVIDEAHCVSAWGHDFRTDYKDLMGLKDQYPGTPIIALTATANNRVLSDIFQCVGPDRLLLKQSFNRPNLIYSVLPKVKDKFESEIAHICLKRFPNKTGIIYCSSKKHCEELATRLRTVGVSTSYYHAGMDNGERERVQESWQAGQIKVICATIAFGMGIDKRDVRFVIHATLPRNMEGYYQETGRAGRDGRESHCFLFYTFADGQVLMQLIEKDRELSFAQRSQNRDLLRRVIGYCENKVDCRRSQVLQYFNEDFDPRLCNKTCDNCINRSLVEMSVKDVSNEAKIIISLVEALNGSNITMIQCIALLRKAKAGSPPQAGALSQWDRTHVERIMHHLYTIGVFEDRIVTNKMGFSNSYLALGSNAMNVASGRVPVKLHFAEAGSSAGYHHAQKRPQDNIANEDMFNRRHRRRRRR
ncbi:ATP-dependent helicase SGS1 [Wickerhamiella sorbophila]|uniref:ATP-dependent DNA helicase n=1 Tax=Wickerhamiella sorbophila TaxID=45607 RepID=A0A2T0FLX5_9ASCO|nr:ATP-dependent helicase SGS1 [Wickerhamiella sorbophila]PRT55991.1 ATP-dependent helicase SGS1 [Wickerhamiella sorbophila]